MILVLIENKKYLTKILSYLDEEHITYTTNPEKKYAYLLIAEISTKIKEFIKENNPKNIIFLTELEEPKIIKYNKKETKTGKNYNLRLHQILNKCMRIIVTMPSISQILNKKVKREIVVIPRELPVINISKSNKDIFEKYHLSKKNKKIIVIDLSYQHLDYIISLATHYSKYQFLYIGYESEYLLSKKNKERLCMIPKNVISIKYIDFNIYSDLCKIAWLVILTNGDEIDQEYLDITLLFKKQLLVEMNLYYEGFFINSKNTYLFQNEEELQLRFKKLIEERVANLTDCAYELIEQNTRKEIVKKYTHYLSF